MRNHAIGPSPLVGLGFVFMSKIFFFVDGFNLYHALDHLEGAKDHNRYHKYKWLSLSRLARCYVPDRRDSISGIEYFTTLASWDPAKVARHKVYIRAQESEGVSVVYGEFKRKDRWCKQCRRSFSTYEEKQTDVNIAVRLFQHAFQEKYDKAIIISGDTDLLPAVRAVKSIYPGKGIGVVIPIGRSSEDFKKQTDFHFKMRESHLASSRYPDILKLADGTTLPCPPTWK